MQSKAKKLRKKMEREGKRNPEHNRQTWDGFNPITRRPQEPIVEWRRKEKKHRPNYFRQSEDESAIFYELDENTRDFNHKMNRPFFEFATLTKSGTPVPEMIQYCYKEVKFNVDPQSL